MHFASMLCFYAIIGDVLVSRLRSQYLDTEIDSFLLVCIDMLNVQEQCIIRIVSVDSGDLVSTRLEHSHEEYLFMVMSSPGKITLQMTHFFIDSWIA